MRTLIVENTHYSFECTVEDDADLDGIFDAIDEDGELVRIHGWQFEITDVTHVDLGGWSPAEEMRAELRQLGSEW